MRVVLTWVCVLCDLSSELFDTGQLNDSPFLSGCSRRVLVFLLALLLFPGSLSGSQKPHTHTHTQMSHLQLTLGTILQIITYKLTMIKT